MRPVRSLLALTLVLAAGAPVAGAASAAEGPRVHLDRPAVAPGEQMVVTLSGFRADLLTVAVCGNLARRGSADCNMTASVTDQRDQLRSASLTLLHAHPPPVPCPCLVRASSASQGEFAVAPLEIAGHPVAPVIGVAEGPLLEVDADIRRASDGFGDAVRGSLAGVTRYRVDLTVRNLTTDTLEHVTVRGSAGNRFADQAATVRFPKVPTLEPGQTWSHTAFAELPAPVIGNYDWEFVASGAGRPITTADRVSATPSLLYAASIVLVVDLAGMAWRFNRRRRQARELVADHDVPVATPAWSM